MNRNTYDFGKCTQENANKCSHQENGGIQQHVSQQAQATHIKIGKQTETNVDKKRKKRKGQGSNGNRDEPNDAEYQRLERLIAHDPHAFFEGIDNAKVLEQKSVSPELGEETENKVKQRHRQEEDHDENVQKKVGK